jgi:hypothetical protein
MILSLKNSARMLSAIIDWPSGGTARFLDRHQFRPSRRNHANVNEDGPGSCTSLFFRGITVFPLVDPGAARPKSVDYAKNEQICR